MAINVTKPAINLREKLNEVTLETGIKGEELLNSDTSTEARNVLELDTHLFTDFESTGIDDNATSTAITIDASENITCGGTVTIDGGTGYGNLEIGGNSGAYIDLKAPNSDDYDARILTTGSGLSITTNTGVGSVRLQHETATKLATTSTGIDVTGSVTADGLTINNTAPYITFKDTDTTDNVTGYLDFRTSADVQKGFVGFNGAGDFELNNLNNNGINFSTTNTERMRIDSSGNVKLTGLSNGTLNFAGGNASGGSKIQAWNDAGNANGYLAIEGYSSEYMRIDSAGNVGIGTSPGSYRLNVQTSTSGEWAGRIAGHYYNNGGLYVRGGNSGYSDALQIEDYNTNRLLTLNGAGNMGLGVVPESATISSYAAFDFGGASKHASLVARNESSQVALTNNAYFIGTSGGHAGSGNSKYVSTDEAAMYTQNASGVHTFHVAPSGTADTAISWTTAMTIDNSGNVLMGRTSAASSDNGWYFMGSGTNQGRAFATIGVTEYVLEVQEQNGSRIGGIYADVSANTTAFMTSSDYRLKENVVPMSGSIDRLKALKPSRFNFIANADKTVDGFLAHEVSDTVPECVSGIKDAMMDEEYEVTPALGEVFIAGIEEVTTEQQVMETVEGDTYVNLAGETITETSEVGKTIEVTTTTIQRQDIDGVMTEVEVEQVSQEPVMETVVTTQAVAEVIVSSNVEKPETDVEGQQWREVTAKVMGEREVEDYQGIDQAKLVPLLVATVQELIAKVEALEAV